MRISGPTSRWLRDGQGNLYITDGYVGIGTDSPTGLLTLDTAKLNVDTDGNLTFTDVSGTKTLASLLSGVSLDGYAKDETVQTHYSQHSEAIQTILKDLDGYGTVSELQGLVNTELEHTIQSSDVFSTIRKDLDGYQNQINGLTQTESEHHDQHSGGIQTILKDLDGYATSTDLSGLTTTVESHKQERYALQKAITDVIDGYALGSDLSGQIATEAEHYLQRSDTIQTILKGLDGYADITTAQGADGYLAFFTGFDTLAGDNDLYFNRITNQLELNNNLISRGIITDDGKALQLGTAATTSHSLASGDVIIGGIAEFKNTIWSAGAVVQAHGSKHYYGGSTINNAYILGHTAYDHFAIGTGSGSGRLVLITDSANGSKNHDHGDQTNPTLFIHSVTDPDIDNTQWLSITHDQTDGYIGVGKGNLKIGADLDLTIGQRIHSSTEALNLGKVAITDHSLVSEDVIVGGALEVDGVAWFDGVTRMVTAFYAQQGVYFGDLTSEPQILDRVSGGAGRALHIRGDTTGNQIIITANNTKNHDHLDQTNPTLFVHSATDPDSDNTEWLSFVHNQTNGLIITGKGTLDLGTTGATSHSLGAGDVLIGNDFEVNGTSWLDGIVVLGGGIRLNNTQSMQFGGSGSSDSLLTTTSSVESLDLALGPNQGRAFTITARTHFGSNYDHGEQTNPTLYIHSAEDPDTDNAQYLSFVHDQTDGYIGLGKGNLKIGADIDLTIGQRLFSSTEALNLGTVAVSNRTLAAGDVILGGRLEVEGVSHFDGNINANAGLTVGDNTEALFGATDGFKIHHRTAPTPNTTLFGVDTESNTVILCQRADTTTDFGGADEIDPTFRIQSADATDTTQWLKFKHNQTDGYIGVGKGNLKIGATVDMTEGQYIHSSTGPLYLGKVSASTYSLGSEDTIVGGNIEFNGTSYFDGVMNLSSNTNLGNGQRLWMRGTSTLDAVIYPVSGRGLTLALGTNVDWTLNLIPAANWNVDPLITPDYLRLNIFSKDTNPNSDNTKRISFYHDDTDAHIEVFSGNLNIDVATTNITGDLSIGGAINNNDLSETFQVITQALDGYGSSGLSEITFQENKNFWNDSIYNLNIAADGYVSSTFTTDLLASATNGPKIFNETSSTTNPTFSPYGTANSGLGGSLNTVTLVSNGQEILSSIYYGFAGANTTINGTTFNNSSTDDNILTVIGTLNGTDAPGGSDIFSAINVDITNTAIVEWNEVNLLRLREDSVDRFRVDIFGNMTVDGYANHTSGTVFNRTATASDLYVDGSQYIIAVTDTSAVRTVFLPEASTLTAGHTFFIKDESGNAGTNNITIQPADAGQTIDGVASVAISSNYGSQQVYTSGGNWFTL